jgi:uncharacterized membrane protein YfcA
MKKSNFYLKDMKMYKKILLILTFMFFMFSNSIIAQESKGIGINNAPPEPESTYSETPLSTLEFVLSTAVLIFGLIIIFFEISLVRSHKINSETAFKFITITLIITSTLFLITAGYSNNQIAPAVGLLGTIAGYLLGRNSVSNQQFDKNEKTN